MSHDQNTHKDTLVISCQESLDISIIQELYNQLYQALETQHGVVIDAAQVQRADTAALQVLHAFVREAKIRGIDVRWQHPSPALQKAAQLLDLGGHLGLSV